MKDTGVASQLSTSGGANTHRFKSFRQRIDAIEINVARRIERDLDEPDEHGSYFSEAVSKWNELNCTKDYTEFLHRVRAYHQSLAQVLYHKDDIVCILEDYLSLEHELALEPMLDLVTTLARDLQEEVLPYYERLVRKIMPLIKSSTPEIVEAASNALAYLFKYLSKSLIEDLRPTFNLISPLLGIERQQSGVRRFAAESLSFLIRKLRGDALQKFVEHVTHALIECPTDQLAGFRDGIALLFFECMRSVKSQLHSRASGMLVALLRELYKEEFSGTRLEGNDVYVLVAEVLKLCLHHADRDASEQLWSVLFDQFDAQARAVAEAEAVRIQPLAALQGLLAMSTILRKGASVGDYRPLFQRCRQSFEVAQALQSNLDRFHDEGDVITILAHGRVKWLTGLLMQCNVAELVTVGKVLLDLAIVVELPSSIIAMALTLARVEWSQWCQIMLPYMVRLTVAKWGEARSSLMVFWVEVFQLGLLQKQGAMASSLVTERGQVVFPTKAAKEPKSSKRRSAEHQDESTRNVARELISWLNEPIDWLEIAEQAQTIPSADRLEFGGFGDDSETESTSSSVLRTAGSEVTVPELELKSAIFTMLAHVSMDANVLLDGLREFIEQLSSAISSISAGLTEGSAYLQHVAAAPAGCNAMGPSDGEIWGDEASKALGLHSAKADRLYWGRYHQLHPMVGLLGRALKLQATAAMNAPASSQLAERLMDAWMLTLDSILPTHYGNPLLFDGLCKTAEALRLLTASDGAAPIVKQKLEAALSLGQLEGLMPLLEHNLMSFQSGLRLQTLKFLALFEQPRMRSGKQGSGDEMCDIIQLGIDLESVPAALDTYKEKTNPLRRMAAYSTNGRVPKMYNRVFPYLALMQLSVNFSLVWTETNKQLALLANANPSLLWAAVWQTLRRFNDERLLVETGLTPEAKTWLSGRQAELASVNALTSQPKLEGFAMECPSLARLDRVLDADFTLFADGAGIGAYLRYAAIAADAQGSERVDYNNVYKQLLKMLADTGARAAETNSKPVVLSFMAFAKHDLGWTASLFRNREDEALELDADLAGFYSEQDRGLVTSRSRRTADALSVLWLGLFAKFRNPGALYKSETLYSLFQRLLSRGDTSVQRQALDCVLAWREPDLVPYADNLRNLVDDKRFRDELKTFNLAVDGESINSVHRDRLLPVAFRLLHGQMVARLGKSSRKDGMKTRRMAIFNAMAGITPAELRSFVFIGLDAFDEVLAAATPKERLAGELLSLSAGDATSRMDVDSDGESSVGLSPGAVEAMKRVSTKAQSSYFHLFLDMVRQLGFKATPVFHETLVILLSSIGCAQREFDAANDDLRELASSRGTDDSMAVDDEEEAEVDAVAAEDSDDEDDANVAANDEEDEDSGSMTLGGIKRRRDSARSIRQMAVKCLAKMFELQPPQFDFTPYVACIYEQVVDPRIDNLTYENTQNSSALLLLLRSWSLSPKYFPYLVDYNPLAFKMLLGILAVPTAHSSVVSLVLDVLQTLLDYSPAVAVEKHLLAEAEAAERAVLVGRTIQGHVSQILSHMRTCFTSDVLSLATTQQQQQQAGKPSGAVTQAMRQIHILSRVAEYATKQGRDAKALLDILLPILKRPNRTVPERTKNDVLKVMLRFVPLVLDSQDAGLTADEKQKLFAVYLEAVSSAFGRIRLDTARATLSQLLVLLAGFGQEGSGPTPLQNAAAVIEGINSYSTERLSEPDFERRLAAYAQLNEDMWSRPDLLDAQAWVPVLYNLKYFAQDHDELSIRSNAAYGLSRYITRVSQACQSEPESAETMLLGRGLTSIVIPAIKHAFTSKHEPVRAEFLGILRKAVRECGPYFAQLRDLMKLDNADEEANFFYNLVHIQQHRRQRALRRFRALVVDSIQAAPELMEVDEENGSESQASDDDDEDAQQSKGSTKTPKSHLQAISPLNFTSGEKELVLSPANIRDLIIPLFEHWVLNEDGSVHHELANDAIYAIGALGSVLPWTQYSSALNRYLGLVKKMPKLEKRLTRLILAFMDNFHFDLRQVKVDSQGRLLSNMVAPPTAATEPQQDDDGDDEEAEQEDAEQADAGIGAERASELQAERIHETIVHKLLPALRKKLSDTNDDNLALRAPVAMSVVRVLTALPPQTMTSQLPGILTTICNMLRSKAQSARNATRDTLVRIGRFLGPSYFGFIVKELMASLSRGPQMHILSYTIFVLLKEIVTISKVGDLDYTVEPIVGILMQDVFGIIADEKDAEGWTTKIKEAKVHHGADCFEMLATIGSFDNVRMLLAPLRDILRETDTPKRTRAVEGVLHRISRGLSRNQSYNTKAVLMFSHGIINQYLTLSTKTAKDTQKSHEEAELQKRLRVSGDDEVTVHMKRTDVGPKRDYLQANAHIFVHFGLEVVYHGLRRSRFDTDDAEVLGLLDPFVDLTGNGLYSRYNSIITQCCKIWAVLVRLPLPSVLEGIPVVIKRLFTLFHQASNTHSDMIQNCFKLLASLLRSKNAEQLMEGYLLPAMEDVVTAAAKDKKPSTPSTPSTSSGVKSLLDGKQLRDLIDFIQPDLEEPERQATAFSLIRAILTRRMAVDSLYTLLDGIRELMITAQTANMREICRLTWFQFLMDYPLGERRLTNAMTFIVQNASGYVFESGRTSALEIMSVIVNRFADEVLLPNAAEPFFLGLVLIIAQDDSSKCREMAAHLLPELIVRFDQPRLQRAWIMLDQWSAGTADSVVPVDSELNAKAARAATIKQQKMRELGRAALQCYGIIIEPLGDRFAKRVPAFLAAVDSALSVSLKTWKQAEAQLNAGQLAATAGDLEKIAANLHSGGNPQEKALTYWETAYMALNTFGRYVSASPQRAMGEAGGARIWLLAVRHLTHPHSWVRLAAARLIGLYVASAEPSWMLEAETEAQIDDAGAVEDWDVPVHRGSPRFVLMPVQRLRDLVNGLMVQLNSRFLSAELGNQVVKNLYFVARCFLTAVPVEEETEAEAVDADADQESDAEEEEDEPETEVVEDEDDTFKRLPKERCLIWLINRVGRLARTEIIRGRGTTEKRTYSFRWFAAIISLVPPTLLRQPAYMMPMASPLYRTSEDSSQAPSYPVTLPNGTVKSPAEQLEEIKALAGEVIRLAQSRIGVTAFSSVLGKIQRHVGDLRNQRREQRRQLAVIDPEQHAKNKIRKHEATRRKRQERTTELSRKKVRTVVRRGHTSRGEVPQ
ncbi:U3 snoRNP protein [Coemansia spiralis]|uniref:U3 snoRNP protein n=1 Tax=Coemansia spiralis TaxID=417178 RepID=A0A9W8GP61_9FUNG|nr:U3 snoRNP protein [Coemansia spiralis]